MYYNTTNLKGDELKTSQKKTISQEQKILKKQKKLSVEEQQFYQRLKNLQQLMHLMRF